MIALDSIPNPYHINLEIWQYLPSILIHYLSAVVATHRIYPFADLRYTFHPGVVS